MQHALSERAWFFWCCVAQTCKFTYHIRKQRMYVDTLFTLLTLWSERKQRIRYYYLGYSKKRFTMKIIHFTININKRLKRTDLKCVNDPFISYLQFSVCMLEGGCLTEEFQNVNYIFSECFFSFISCIFSFFLFPSLAVGRGVVVFESTACTALGIRYISVNERWKEFLCVHEYVREQGIETEKEI